MQLYGIGFGSLGGTGGIPQDAIGQLSALRFTALKTMENLLPGMNALVPAPQSFRVNPVFFQLLNKVLKRSRLNQTIQNLDYSKIGQRSTIQNPDMSGFHYSWSKYTTYVVGVLVKQLL